MVQDKDLGPLKSWNTKVKESTLKDIKDFQYLTDKGQREIMEEALELWEAQKLTPAQKEKLKELRDLRK